MRKAVICSSLRNQTVLRNIQLYMILLAYISRKPGNQAEIETIEFHVGLLASRGIDPPLDDPHGPKRSERRQSRERPGGADLNERRGRIRSRGPQQLHT